MNPKQLANVLIKILGLSLCVQSLMHIVTGILNIIASTGRTGSGYFLWSNFFTGGLLAAIGICFIVGSRKVADLLLKGEGEETKTDRS